MICAANEKGFPSAMQVASADRTSIRYSGEYALMASSIEQGSPPPATSSMARDSLDHLNCSEGRSIDHEPTGPVLMAICNSACASHSCCSDIRWEVMFRAVPR